MQLRDEGGWSSMEMVERYRHNRPLQDRTKMPDPTGKREPAKVYDLRRRVN